MYRRTHARHRVRREGAPNYSRGGGAHHSAKAFFIDELLESVRVVLRGTDSACSPREILLAAGSSGSAPPISRGEQLAPLPNWQSQPSVEGLRL
jgi:hypothetical protein